MAFHVQYDTGAHFSNFIYHCFFFVNCIVQFFSTGVLLAFLEEYVLLCDDTDYRTFGLLDFSTKNANSTSPSLWQPKMPPPIFEPPVVILYSCSRSVLELHLLSCLYSLFFCFLSYSIPILLLPSCLHTLTYDAFMKLSSFLVQRDFSFLLNSQESLSAYHMPGSLVTCFICIFSS